MSLEKTFETQVDKLHAKSREIAGQDWWDRGNISTYGTPQSGKMGLAVHRLGSLLATPNPEAKAGSKVARAFGNKASTKAAKAAWSTPGTEIMSLPVRSLFNPDAPKKDDGQDQEQDQSDAPIIQNSAPGPQSKANVPASPAALRAAAEELQNSFHQSGLASHPSSQGAAPQAKPYSHVFNPVSGEIEAA